METGQMVLHKTNDAAGAWRRFRETLRFLRITPVYYLSGGRIESVSEDFRSLVIRIPHNWLTRNLVNSVFGGSLFAATDPVYMAMLMHGLGSEYFVIDKEGRLEYLKPLTEDGFAAFTLSEADFESIKAECAAKKKAIRSFPVVVQSSDGTVVARGERTLYIRKMSAQSVNSRLKRRM
jgi:acyl-coenzyme A thioesterase PaaI-like protein